MSRLTIPKIRFKSLTQITPDYLSLPSINIQGHIIQKPDFLLHQVSSIWLILFPFTGAIWTTSGQKDPDDPNLIETLIGPHEPHLIQKNPVKIVCITLCRYPLTIKVPNLNKKRNEMKKRIMIFPSCIWDIWINSTKRSPYERNEKS